jgi:IMP dehydrogenase/GMP reductase
MGNIGGVTALGAKMKIFERGYNFDEVLIKPIYSNVSSRTEPDTTTKICNQDYLIPIVPANMDCIASLDMYNVTKHNGGFFIHHRFVSPKDICNTDFVTIGLRDFGTTAWEQKIYTYLDRHIVNWMIDIAHAHTHNVMDAITKLNKISPISKISVGNVATKEAVRDFANQGVSCVKIGIGPSDVCRTRETTGVGVPQFSATLECAEEAKKFKMSVIADGGIKSGADFCKAIAAGADCVMIGGMIAGTNEASGRWFVKDQDTEKSLTEGEEIWWKTERPECLYREYWGQSSEDFQQKWYGGVKPLTVPEGARKLVKWIGPVDDVINTLIGSLKSSMSYLGAKNIEEYQSKASFILTNSIK